MLYRGVARNPTLSDRRLMQERQRLLREVASLSTVMRGSLFERFSTCSRPNCACHRGERHGPRTYLAVTQEKRQRQHYVPQSQVHAVRHGVQQYHRLLQIVDRLTTIHVELMRKGLLDEPDP